MEKIKSRALSETFSNFLSYRNHEIISICRFTLLSFAGDLYAVTDYYQQVKLTRHVNQARSLRMGTSTGELGETPVLQTCVSQSLVTITKRLRKRFRITNSYNGMGMAPIRFPTTAVTWVLCVRRPAVKEGTIPQPGVADPHDQAQAGLLSLVPGGRKER